MNADRFVAATFRKASGSGDAGCVEVAYADDVTGIRDSKRPGCGVLCFTTLEWRVFLGAVRNSQFVPPA